MSLMTGERSTCAMAGLFMQNIAEYAENKGGDFDDTDMYHPCNKIDGTENEEAATLLLQVSGKLLPDSGRI